MPLSSIQPRSSKEGGHESATTGPPLLEQLLSDSAEATAALNALRSETVRHDKFFSVFSQVVHQAQFAPPGHLIFVIGPTGAGKTTLAKALGRQLGDHFRAIGTAENEVAFFYMDLKLEHSKEFVWRRFYLGALRAIREPLLNKKVDLRAELQQLREEGVIIGTQAIGDQDIGSLRELLEKQLVLRRTRYALIDEGNLLAMVKGTRADRKSQMEVLKSLAGSVPSTRFIFFATSDALPLLHLSPQLSRRVVVIRFDPYSSNKDELKALGGGLLPYLTKIPCGFDFDLGRRIRAIQATTSGLFGATAEWIQRAVPLAVAERRPISWPDMEATKPDILTIASLKSDVDQFCRYFSGKTGHGSAETNSKSSNGKKGARRPGKRNPERDSPEVHT